MKILTIDDNHDNLSIINAIIKLSLPEYKVITALSGIEGISKAKEEIPDIILLDIVMPGMDGYETCKALKQNKLTKDIPVIFLTAIDTNAESKTRAFELGADAFLSKPIEPIDLVAQIKVLLRYKAAENKLKIERANLEKEIEKRTSDLKASELKYRSLIESSLQPIIVIKDGLVVFANQISMELSGYSEDQILNKPFTNVIYSEDQPKMIDNYKKRMLNQVYDENLQFRIRTKDNKFFWFEYKANSIKWEGENATLYALNDVTKLKEFSQLERTNKDRLQLMLDLYNESDNLEKVELYKYALDKAVSITNSDIGFFHEYDEDTHTVKLNVWNNKALNNCLSPEETHYPLNMAGNWADSIRQRKTVVYNDFANSPHQKGLPDGHVSLTKFMSVPVLLNEKIFYIFGVGDKEEDYNDTDVENIQIIANELSKILQKKRYEEEILRERDIAEQNEYRFKALHNASFGGIAIHDKGLIMDCNKGLSRITGYSYKELVNSDGLRLIAEGSRDKVIRKINEGSEVSYEATGLRKNGEEYPLRLEGKNIPYKGKQVRVVEFRDITQEKRLKNEQFRKEQLLNETGRLAKIGGWELDVPSMKSYYSQETKRIYGIPLDADPPTGIEGIKFYHKDSRPVIQKAVKEALEHGKPYDLEVKFINMQGRELWVRTIGLAEKKDGIVSRLYGTFQDITEQKRSEEELIEAKNKAQQSDRLKTAFLANMSHEIRTPMNGILGYIELLRLPDITEQERDDYSNVIRKSSDRLLNTINDIIEFSKIEAGDIPISREEFNLKEVIESIVFFFEQEADNKGLNLSLIIDNNTPSENIKSDRTKLESVLTNLIKNALKFTDQGHITVIVEPADGIIKITVKDTGCGIPGDKIDLIFERFMQADITMTRGHEGSGLGLSICKAYVEKLGGKMWVDSEEGKGSSFYFTIPYLLSEAKSVHHNTADNEVFYAKTGKVSEKIKVLVAEDDETSFSLLANFMEIDYDNVDLIHAIDGNEAIELFKNNRDVALVIMDIKMPVKNGFEATREIKAIDPDIPIISVTAFAMPGDKEKAIAAGCDDYLVKPISRISLKKKIGPFIGNEGS